MSITSNGRRTSRTSSLVWGISRLSKVIRSYQRDVLNNGFDCEEFQQRKADAVFLDLPKPETAVLHAKKILRPKGYLCSFSPCIEQINETAKTLSQHGFSNIRMVECIERNYSKKKMLLRNLVDGTEKEVLGLSGGELTNKTHTGYLLFALNLISN